MGKGHKDFFCPVCEEVCIDTNAKTHIVRQVKCRKDQVLTEQGKLNLAQQIKYNRIFTKITMLKKAGKYLTRQESLALELILRLLKVIVIDGEFNKVPILKMFEGE